MLFFLHILCLLGCEDELIYTRSQMLEMAKSYDPDLELVIPKDLNSGVRCKHSDGTPFYGKGCVSAFTVQSGYLDFIILEFTTMEEAKNEATRLNQFYARNWVFDKVNKEPLLEKFVRKAFDAAKAEP